MAPYYYPTDYPYNYPQNQQKTVIDRVQGEASANVYPVQPGQEVILFDIDNPFVYKKERGLDNKLIQKRFRLVEDEPVIEEPKVDLSGYVKADEVAQMISEAIDKRLAEMSSRKKKVAEE